MPGVPSGRGCETCRKQKKKCDQSKPSCSRCTRLNVECIGSGLRRFKFKQETGGSSSSSNSRLSQRSLSTTVLELSPTPSNESTRISSAFIRTLDVTDIRYDISCYGDFLKEVPKRLGRNESLDAAVNALTVGYSAYRRFPHEPFSDAEAISSYVHALGALRTCLDEPAKAQTADTLCAMYMIMICEGWLTKGKKSYTRHGEAMAHIMENATSRRWQGGFEADILVTMCVPVLFESLYNPNIQLGPWLWKLTDMYQPRRPLDRQSTSPYESLKLQNIARITAYVRCPSLYVFEIQSTYRQMQLDIPGLRSRLAKVSEPNCDGTIQTPLQRILAIKVLARVRLAHSLLLSFAILLNGVLRAIQPHAIALVEESEIFCSEIVILARQAAQDRPMGSSYMPFCLISAWAVTVDTSKQTEIKRILAEYQSDFTEVIWMDMAIWLKKRLITQPLQLTTSVLELSGSVVGGD